MIRRDSIGLRHRVRASVLVLVLALALASAGVPPTRGRADTQGPPAVHAMAGMAMTDATMQQQVDAWYAAHPARGTSTTAAPVDSFLANGFVFDLNTVGFGGTVDTAKINVGETVLFKWLSGSHTVTNGTSSLDPNVGTLFDVPLDITHLRFSYTFNTAGTYVFFCRIHESFNMFGVVKVAAPTGVEPVAGEAAGWGFASAPWPNPTRGGASFRFAIARPGRARVSVFDLEGRRVAVPVDLEMGAGSHSGSWDGRTSGGAPAPAGVYVLRLEAPGTTDTRRVTIER